MFQGLDKDQLRGAVEALLFVSDEPVGTITLADMIEVEPADIEQALDDLREQLASDNRGIQLREVAGGWRLYTHPVYHELLEKYVLSWDTRRMTQASMETLAIVAYLQPITRSGVSSVRGVNSDSSINSLMEKGLLREAGTADSPGNPTLYATTQTFLEKFGLRSTADLPDLDQFAPDDETREIIRERLSATRETMQADEEAGDDAQSNSLDNLHFEIDDTETIHAVQDPHKEAAFDAAQQMLTEAVASGFGLVEKIDFDNLTFETDDE